MVHRAPRATAWTSGLLALVFACTSEPPNYLKASSADEGSPDDPSAQKSPAEGDASPASADANAPVIEPTIRYREPDAEVVEILDAPPTPGIATAGDGKHMVLAERPTMPDIALLAEPMLGLAGERINPDTNEVRRTRFYQRLSVVDTQGSSEDAEPVPVEGLPEAAALSFPDWSPDGRKFAFTHTAEDHVELWVVDDLAKPVARRLGARPLNATFGDGFRWLPTSEGLIVQLVPADRGPAPVAPPVAMGPDIEESSGRAATNRTYRDLLQGPLDDALFAHYFTSELGHVGLDGSLRVLGPKDDAKARQGVFAVASPAPNGEWLLVERLAEPYSHAVPWYRFAHTKELWSLTDAGAPAQRIAKLPAAEEVPIQGVPTGPRAFRWQPMQPATLVWAEALDEGDPRKEVEHRDRLQRLSAPFDGRSCADGETFAKTQHRYSGLSWLEREGQYLMREYDRDRKWSTTHLRDLARPDYDRVLFDRSVYDLYGDPGDPVRRELADGSVVVRVDEGAIYLAGDGASPDGDRPFLDRLDLDDEGAEAERLFEAPADAYAYYAAFVEDTDTMIVGRQSSTEPPNWYREAIDQREDSAGTEPVQITAFPHPHPKYGSIDKQLLKYKRKDGVPLSATLYLPPGYDPDSGERLPMVLWAYPVEYVDASTAGQVDASPTSFTRLSGSSPTLFVTQGYAVLYAAMPVVGDPETMNDTLIPQLVDGAEAAIAAAVATGTVDGDRVGVGGHSYGAFMVANLLAHSDLFKAGIARSGAYNRSLTPFGFQSERRSLWEATDTYVAVSPMFAADTLDEPILMIHGEIDDNSGTFPIQTRRLFHALQGLGGTARMVILPHEAHGYRGRQSILHALVESFEWFDQHVKKVPPAATLDADPPG
ncbi:S9 family peptidase [Plesiocystis pacifica]|nr:prolyl oligopeptidase family serine peptidase [Plesiocystis pacifica]